LTLTIKSTRWIRRLGAFVLVSAVATAGLSTPIGVASASASKGAELLKACVAAMTHEQGVHWTSTTNAVDATTHQTVTVTISSDAGQSSGSQSIAFKEGSESGTERIELVDSTAYMNGGTFVLENFNGMPTADAKHFANVWIKIGSSSSAYSETAAGLTLSSLESEVEIPSPTLLSGNQVVLGHKTEELETTAKEDGVQVRVALYVQAHGLPLPVEEITTTPTSRSTMAFGSWGERVRVSTPRNWMPLP
jgi:hypothetical protein